MKMAVWSLIIGTIGYVQYVVLTSKCRGNDQRCLIKKVFIENFPIHRKTPVLESSF